MRGLVTAGPCVRLERIRWSMDERDLGFPYGTRLLIARGAGHGLSNRKCSYFCPANPQPYRPLHPQGRSERRSRRSRVRLTKGRRGCVRWDDRCSRKGQASPTPMCSSQPRERAGTTCEAGSLGDRVSPRRAERRVVERECPSMFFADRPVCLRRSWVTWPRQDQFSRHASGELTILAGQ